MILFDNWQFLFSVDYNHHILPFGYNNQLFKIHKWQIEGLVLVCLTTNIYFPSLENLPNHILEAVIIIIIVTTATKDPFI